MKRAGRGPAVVEKSPTEQWEMRLEGTGARKKNRFKTRKKIFSYERQQPVSIFWQEKDMIK